jgi:hypothetical protein
MSDVDYRGPSPFLALREHYRGRENGLQAQIVDLARRLAEREGSTRCRPGLGSCQGYGQGKGLSASVFAESTATFHVKGAPIQFTFVAGASDGPTSAVVTLASVREYRLVRQQ